MKDIERLVRVETLMEETLKQLADRKASDEEQTECISQVKDLMQTLIEKTDATEEVNRKQQEQISALMQEVETLRGIIDFCNKFKKFFSNKFVILIIGLIIFAFASNNAFKDFVLSLLF